MRADKGEIGPGVSRKPSRARGEAWAQRLGRPGGRSPTVGERGGPSAASKAVRGVLAEIGGLGRTGIAAPGGPRTGGKKAGPDFVLD